MQTQILKMRENLVCLTQAMEAIAAEADSRQREVNNLSKSSFGLNSQHRALLKGLSS